MKHVKALVVKAIMIWAILRVVLTGLYGVSFMDSTIVGVIIVVMIYVLGDLLILRKVGNIAATIADAGSAAVILWLYLYFMNDTVDIWMKVLIPALLIGVAEWFFHKWLLSQGIVPDERNNHKLFLLKKPLRLFSDLNGFFYLFIKIKFHFSMIQSIRPLLHDYVFGH